MNYKEKYKEMKKCVLAIGQGYVKEVDYSSPRSIAEYIDPDLKESDGERIRKGLIKGLSAMRDIHKHQTFSDDAINIDDAIAWLEKQGEQKPIERDTEVHDLWVYIREWNEKFGRLPKDEDELTSCIDYVMKRQKAAWSEKHIADVFEKVGLAKIVREQGNDQLTNAVQSAMIELSKQQNTAWSEEDRKHIDNIISLLNQAKERFVRESGQFPSWITEILWLESIKDRIQSQQEWSKEDEKMLTSTIEYLNEFREVYQKGAQECIAWLKSIKPNHWKPSEKQMSMLLAVLNDSNNITSESVYIALKSLYNDLKKL